MLFLTQIWEYCSRRVKPTHYALSRDMAQGALILYFMGLLPVLGGHLMDRLCIQILIVNTHSPFYYI